MITSSRVTGKGGHGTCTAQNGAVVKASEPYQPLFSHRTRLLVLALLVIAFVHHFSGSE